MAQENKIYYCYSKGHYKCSHTIDGNWLILSKNYKYGTKNYKYDTKFPHDNILVNIFNRDIGIFESTLFLDKRYVISEIKLVPDQFLDLLNSADPTTTKIGYTALLSHLNNYKDDS